jgi:hypothetical protein
LKIKKQESMARKRFCAIMGCSKRDYQDINELGVRVCEIMYANPEIYSHPPLTDLQLRAKVDLCLDAQANVEGGSIKDTVNRNVKLADLHETLKYDFLIYVNGLWMGNEKNLVLSGFPLCKEPTPHGVPETPVIKRIVNGAEPGTVKIMLEKRTGPQNERRDSLLYTVYMSKDLTDDSTLIRVLTTSNSRALIVRDVPKESVIYYCVSAHRGSVESKLSAKVKYMLF